MSGPTVPVIDLAELTDISLSDVGVPDTVVQQVADAAARFGFFQVVNHGISGQTIDAVWRQATAFFAQPIETKRRIMRTKENTRGYYDRELTKNARDLKEVLDIAHVPFPDLPAGDPRNHHEVDGRNQWPDIDGFVDTMVEYLQDCERVALRLLAAFAVGLGEAPDRLHPHFVGDHTSFIRLNHYPLGDLLSADEAQDVTALGDMALHHHSDAGALTLLLQDDVGGLQVQLGDSWVDVEPLDGALVVNTGDMMQVWSNDRYQAALHRVRPVTDRPRLSVPYFFNPSYRTDYAPLPGSVAPGDAPHYRTINWGGFRQARADGDFADYGAEVQIADFLIIDADR
ncbi:MAG: 2OG-Fe(II) oxygenase family protein [Actinomycetota bacterium]